MERRVLRKGHARCEVGENPEEVYVAPPHIPSKRLPITIRVYLPEGR